MKTYLFASSRPGVPPHRTTVHDNGMITCTCPARVECWHKKRVRDRQDIVGRTEGTTLPVEDHRQLLRLLSEGNDTGAFALARELFPSMCEEETSELLDEVREHHPRTCMIDDCHVCAEYYHELEAKISTELDTAPPDDDERPD